MNLGTWTSAVHAWSLDNEKTITADDARRMFGNPPCASSAARMLRASASRGWFERSEIDGESVYMAIRPVEGRKPPGVSRSYFDGLKRVRSVFELGDSP
jgi:hypothetical protein